MSEKETTIEMTPLNALESINRAEIDVQIATAKKYPRNLVAVRNEILEMATIDEETASSCFYSVPRGGKTIHGPSVRLAEIALSCFGNCRAGSRIVEVAVDTNNPHVTIQAVAHDLQKNTATTMEKRRRIVGKKANKGVIDEDDINLAVNACTAIALRDAIFKVVPGALIKPAFDAARKVAIGDIKTLNDRRAKAVEAFGKMGVTPERVLGAVGKRKIEEVGLEELETLIGLYNAIKDGTTSVDAAFPIAHKPEHGVEKPKFKEEKKKEETTGVVPPNVNLRNEEPKKDEPISDEDIEWLKKEAQKE